MLYSTNFCEASRNGCPVDAEGREQYPKRIKISAEEFAWPTPHTFITLLTDAIATGDPQYTLSRPLFTHKAVRENAKLEVGDKRRWADSRDESYDVIAQRACWHPTRIGERTTVGEAYDSEMVPTLDCDSAKTCIMRDTPCFLGRTGLGGQGLLGKWGPNAACDPIVTRENPETQEFEACVVERRDAPGVFAFPGGMDEGDGIGPTLKREFREEACDNPTVVEKLFTSEECDRGIIYTGDVDDQRNTDHAWMQTCAKWFHCTAHIGSVLKLKVTDTAEIRKVQWVAVKKLLDPAGPGMYASHGTWLKTVERLYTRSKAVGAAYPMARR
jgi:ADP-ribose pyrophosphatase YjhB (NUDIX family)